MRATFGLLAVLISISALRNAQAQSLAFTVIPAVPLKQAPRPTSRDSSATLADSETSRPTEAAEVPQLAFAQHAFGVPTASYGASGFGASHGGGSGPSSRLDGGLRLWGSPLSRVTMTAEASRRESGELAPSLSAAVRVAGARSSGAALALLGRYKAEGFAELEGEVEVGVMGSLVNRGVHLDANVLVGAGFEEQESDGELMIRAGYDIGQDFRLGAEGRARYRLSGSARLAGGRDWDAFAGPQFFAHRQNLFAAVTAAVSNVGTASGAGWLATFLVGYSTF